LQGLLDDFVVVACTENVQGDVQWNFSRLDRNQQPVFTLLQQLKDSVDVFHA